MEITIMTVFLLLLAAVIATVIRVADIPSLPFSKDSMVKILQTFVYSLVTAFLAMYVLELLGLTLSLDEMAGFMVVVATAVGGMSVARAILEKVKKMFPSA
jgi:hypothetical protein